MSPPLGTQRATVMITVKASPEIGRAHGETVCVAGVRLDLEAPQWIRLFPVQWPWFWQAGHPKYQVIEVDVKKHERDQRRESHRPMLDTVSVVREKSSPAQRAEVLNGLPQYTMCELLAAKGWGRPSIGLVAPRSIDDFTWNDQSTDPAQIKKMRQAAQGSLLAQDAPTLEFCPFVFRFRYHCLSPTCGGHHQTIVDWEISEAWRRWRNEYPDDFLDRIKSKWMSLVGADRQPAFYVGNQQQAPQGFLVLGVARDVTPVEPSPVDLGGEGGRQRSTDDTSNDPPQSKEGRLFDP